MVPFEIRCLAIFVAVIIVPRWGFADDEVDYSREVRPVLSANCFSCHGQDEEAREGDLRLDQAPSTPEEIARLAPGRPEMSELVRRITSDDPDTQMPPPDSGHTLTDEQIQLLKRWVAAGAQYSKHWAYEVPTATKLPIVDSDWCQQPLDQFILRRMRDHQLKPAPAAPPHLLIRRLYLDLIGLPPTPEQADEFAQEPSKEVYERIVDELLRSPQFGEHWARMWLDLARYADTKGYEKDQPREIWRYRDWVIDALNVDMPFDQFTTEQIAGDLLPSPATSQLLATAFHRNTMTNDEGGTDNEEFRLAAVKDRVDTTVQVWMGLTMGCAKCHSHKYDPITQEEYYRFLAFFNQTEDADRPDDAPRIATPTSSQEESLATLTTLIAELREQYDAVTPELLAAQRVWEKTLARSSTWQALKPTGATSAEGSTLTIQQDRSILASGKMPPRDVYTLDLSADEQQPITAIRIEALTDPSLPNQGPGRNANDPNFVLSELTVELVKGADVSPLALHQAKADFSQNQWQVAKAIDGNQETGWAISPQKGKAHVAIFSFKEPLQLGTSDVLRVKLSQQYAPNSLLLGRVRISISTQPFADLKPTQSSFAFLASIPYEKRTKAQEKQLRDEFRRTAPETAHLFKQLNALEEQKSAIEKRIVKTPVMRDLPENRRRKTFVHVRGNFLNPGDEVSPAFPKAFAIELDKPTHTRLDVAKWLVSAENPLTARVMVNRVWARVFGRGLVETEEDFGVQGNLPTHPQLLDHLAIEFRETHHWSLKRLLKSIVLSATYQQDATIHANHRERDPTNRWLSRGARFRLSAEAVRDQALAIPGLLSTKVGGPSVMPPQPDGIWKATYSSLKWTTSKGEDRYRRGLYTYVRRTSPYPSMLTFDAGTREVCQIRRIRTNTPLQALVVMNDPVYVEAAGALARLSHDDDPRTALTKMFRRVLIRPPTEDEIQRVMALYEEVLTDYQSSPAAVKQLLEAANLTSGDEDVALAARTLVANALLNLDETFTRP